MFRSVVGNGDEGVTFVAFTKLLAILVDGLISPRPLVIISCTKLIIFVEGRKGVGLLDNDVVVVDKTTGTGASTDDVATSDEDVIIFVDNNRVGDVKTFMDDSVLDSIDFISFSANDVDGCIITSGVFVWLSVVKVTWNSSTIVCMLSVDGEIDLMEEDGLSSFELDDDDDDDDDGGDGITILLLPDEIDVDFSSGSNDDEARISTEVDDEIVDEMMMTSDAVSYTHLTLPTICSV